MTGSTELDLEFVRDRFPDLDGWAMFENAGGTLAVRNVSDRVAYYMTHTHVQPGAEFPASAHAAQRISESERQMAAMINADADEIVIGPSTTTNVYMLAQAIAHWFAPGDELVVTNLDHEANNGAWRRLAEHGVRVREWALNPDTAELEHDDLDALLNERTRLVCVTHCSNITGTLHDIADIARRVHAAGALLFVDGVAYAPHRRIDVRALDVDFYACSLYKLYGPHLGLLYGRRELLARTKNQSHFFLDDFGPDQRLAPGGPNHELTASLSGIVDYFDQLYRHHDGESHSAGLNQRLDAVFERIAAHEEHLAERFVDYLRSSNRIRVIGRTESDRHRRVPTFSFTVAGHNASEIPAALLRHRIAIRSGDFYARRCIDALGLGAAGGVVRASMVHYNTESEVDRLIAALDATVQ